MSDNIIKFRKKEEPKAPKVKRPLSQQQFRQRILLGIVAFLIASWCFFTLTGA
jgi:hypothetical protein